MSFIEDLRNAMAAVSPNSEDRNAAKFVSTAGSMAKNYVGDKALEYGILSALGAPAWAAKKGWDLAENISDAKKWAKEDAQQNSNNAGNSESFTFTKDGYEVTTDANGNVTMKKTDEKNEEGLAEGQDGSTTPVEQKDTEEAKAPSYDIDEMAGEFILGAWGNGQDRIDNMVNAGYTIDDYNKIQQRVNDAYASGRDLHEWTNNAAHKLGYW